MSFLIAASVLALASPSEEPAHDHGPQLGKVSFETTCKPQAEALFRRGLSWLHSFGYPQAERSFSDAVKVDPSCAIAHWGAAISYYHPLWYPPTPADLQNAAIALSKARRTGARSQRERDYVSALGAFYDNAATVDHNSRVRAYGSAMAQLHQRYPDDRDAAALYALSLIAAGTLDNDPAYRLEKQAGAILNTLFEAEPDHPGVAHYLIHGFDYPALASLALPAARRYASIAPDSSHAHHMPSHIFTRLGLWDESIHSNRAAESSARAWSAANGMPATSDQRLHAMDYLTYAYLQTGRDSEAMLVLDQLKAIDRVEPASQTAAYALTAIPARVLLERRQWREAASFVFPRHLSSLEVLADFKWAEANIAFAKAVGAARSGDQIAAREMVARLVAIEANLVVAAGEYDWRKQVAIERQIAEAWLASTEGRKDEAIRIMRAAADLDDATEKHPVTPGAVLPAREQLAEMLLEQGRPAEALAEFEASLRRAPRRLAGLFGAARSARLFGASSKTDRYYVELRDLTANSNEARAEVMEARSLSAKTTER